MIGFRAFSRADDGSMPLAMLLILVSVSLSALMTPLLLTQVSAARNDSRRVQALHAAQAGIDVAMAYIRAAQDDAHRGILTKLPCRRFTGDVGGGGARYEVTSIVYYDKDPRDPTARTVPCSGGYPNRAPRFAVITSVGTNAGSAGTADSARRELTATYVFTVTNAGIPGGLVHVYKNATTNDLCLAAGSGSPASGTALKVKNCDRTDPAQIWIYNRFLMLTLASTRTQSRPLGMCVDMVAPQTAGRAALIADCAGVTQPRQQWSLNDSANLQGTTDGVKLDGACLVVKNADQAESPVVAGACGGRYDNVHTWSLEATVGTGAAGGDTGQVVNFSQFARCMDITGADVDRGYLIVWPCKQAPDPGNVPWNQKFTMPPIDPVTKWGRGRITTTKPSTNVTYCLRSPGSIAPARYVTVVTCPANPTDETTWTFYGPSTSYATSYLLVDHRGYCMTPTDPTVDRHPDGQNVSKIVVATCDGSSAQKWNAPPNVQLLFPLKDLHEK